MDDKKQMYYMIQGLASLFCNNVIYHYGEDVIIEREEMILWISQFRNMIAEEKHTLFDEQLTDWIYHIDTLQGFADN
jgi:hypothetical protein